MALLEASGADLTMHARAVVDGSMFMLQSALALGVTAATVLAVAAGTAKQAAADSLVFVVAAAASAWIPQDIQSWPLAAGTLLVLGSLSASGARLASIAGWCALVVAGVAAGLAGGLPIATWEETLGGVAALMPLVLAGLLFGIRIAVPPRLQRTAVTARRAAGAWIAAVGVLLLAMWALSANHVQRTTRADSFSWPFVDGRQASRPSLPGSLRPSCTRPARPTGRV